MKIEIINGSTSGTNGVVIYVEGKPHPIRNFRNHITDLNGFDDNEIEALLGTDYPKYEEGKYQFNVSANHLKLITGERLPTTKRELTLLETYGIKH